MTYRVAVAAVIVGGTLVWQMVKRFIDLMLNVLYRRRDVEHICHQQRCWVNIL